MVLLHIVISKAKMNVIDKVVNILDTQEEFTGQAVKRNCPGGFSTERKKSL